MTLGKCRNFQDSEQCSRMELTWGENAVLVSYELRKKGKRREKEFLELIITQ
jgi:hypothetical protein